jgi:hypothetical protein
MPKLVIDYSNTIIYKIFCNDPNVKDIYVGHTTNFVQRKHAHKQNCTNSNSICYDLKVYKIIRNNGGWDNWTMEIVNFFKCKDNYEARKKEQEYFVLLNATLNSIEPLPPPKVSQKSDTLTDKKNNVKQLFYCKKCNISFSTEKLLNLHNSTKKHNMDINIRLQPKNPGNPPTYVCDYCHYKTCSRKDFDKHNLTKKHIYNKDNKSTTQTTSHHNTGYTCVCMCGKSYNHRASLYNHKKKCIMCKEGDNKTMDKSVNNELLEESFGDEMIDGMGENTIVGDKLNITTDMFMKLMNDNQEMIKIIKEQQHQINAIIPKIGNVTTNNNMTTNMTNNNFNLNFFLNEKCKDALNMSEFIESLKITLEDFQYYRSNGLVQGISNVMIRGLKELDIYKRPIHCTDVKRDTMYIKDKEKWEKDESHEKMRNTIIKIANKERNAISSWVEQNPDWFDTEAKQMEYLTIINKICEPIENDVKNEKKIIKIIGKEIILNKDIAKLLKN